MADPDLVTAIRVIEARQRIEALRLEIAETEMCIARLLSEPFARFDPPGGFKLAVDAHDQQTVLAPPRRAGPPFLLRRETWFVAGIQAAVAWFVILTVLVFGPLTGAAMLGVLGLTPLGVAVLVPAAVSIMAVLAGHYLEVTATRRVTGSR